MISIGVMLIVHTIYLVDPKADRRSGYLRRPDVNTLLLYSELDRNTWSYKVFINIAYDVFNTKIVRGPIPSLCLTLCDVFLAQLTRHHVRGVF